MKAQLSLSLLAILQLGLVFLLNRPEAPPSPLLRGIERGDIQAIRLEDGDEGLHFEKQRKRWRLSALGNYPAESAKLESLLDRLFELIEEPAPAATRSRAEAELFAHPGRVLLQSQGAERALLWAESEGKLYLKREGETGFIEAPELNADALRPSLWRWARPQLFWLRPESVDTLSYRGPDRSFTASKSQKTWSAEASAWLQAVLELQIEAPLPFEAPAPDLDWTHITLWDALGRKQAELLMAPQSSEPQVAYELVRGYRVRLSSGALRRRNQ